MKTFYLFFPFFCSDSSFSSQSLNIEVAKAQMASLFFTLTPSEVSTSVQGVHAFTLMTLNFYLQPPSRAPASGTPPPGWPPPSMNSWHVQLHMSDTDLLHCPSEPAPPRLLQSLLIFDCWAVAV